MSYTPLDMRETSVPSAYLAKRLALNSATLHISLTG
jgi:hypothetical protein